VDVLVAVVTAASLAAKNSTNTIPIVMVGVSDPVATELVTALALWNPANIRARPACHEVQTSAAHGVDLI